MELCEIMVFGTVGHNFLWTIKKKLTVNSDHYITVLESFVISHLKCLGSDSKAFYFWQNGTKLHPAWLFFSSYSHVLSLVLGAFSDFWSYYPWPFPVKILENHVCWRHMMIIQDVRLINIDKVTVIDEEIVLWWFPEMLANMYRLRWMPSL